MSADALPAEPIDSAWVLTSEQPHRVRRAVRLLRRVGATRIVPQSRWRVCVAIEEPSTRLMVRAARRLGGPVEARVDCDVAWAPAGTGYLLLTVAQPAPRLDTVLDASAPAYRDVVRPGDLEQPIRVCVPQLALADPTALAETLRAQGIEVLGLYEVGACRR